MNHTVLAPHILAGLKTIAETTTPKPGDSEEEMKAYTTGLLAGGALMAQTILEMLNIPFTDNIPNV